MVHKKHSRSGDTAAEQTPPAPRNIYDCHGAVIPGIRNGRTQKREKGPPSLFPENHLSCSLECSGPGPSSSAVAPRFRRRSHLQKCFSHGFRRIVRFDHDGDDTIHRFTRIRAHLLFGLIHGTKGSTLEFVRMHIRLLHDRGQNHSLVNNRTDDDYQGNTSASQLPLWPCSRFYCHSASPRRLPEPRTKWHKAARE